VSRVGVLACTLMCSLHNSRHRFLWRPLPLTSVLLKTQTLKPKLLEMFVSAAPHSATHCSGALPSDGSHRCRLAGACTRLNPARSLSVLVLKWLAA